MNRPEAHETSLSGCRDVTVNFDCAVLDLIADYAAARKIRITEAVRRLVNIALLETSEWTDYLTKPNEERAAR
jgi:hypothetical protein